MHKNLSNNKQKYTKIYNIMQKHTNILIIIYGHIQKYAEVKNKNTQEYTKIYEHIQNKIYI